MKKENIKVYEKLNEINEILSIRDFNLFSDRILKNKYKRNDKHRIFNTEL